MFYKKGIDITNAKQMFEFINGHFKYWTMNSWNNLSSIANNVKVYNLKLDGKWDTALRYLTSDNDIGDLQVEINCRLKDWEADHKGYALGFNGRSGGYLVMYNEEPSGRVNFRTILPYDLDGFDNYEEWKAYLKDNGWLVKDFISTLKEYTQLIQSFDKLCDELRDLVNEYSKMDYDADVKAFNLEYGTHEGE